MEDLQKRLTEIARDPYCKITDIRLVDGSEPEIHIEYSYVGEQHVISFFVPSYVINLDSDMYPHHTPNHKPNTKI